MNARLILNEIRKGEDSGLGSIGIGHTIFLKGAAYIKHRWPKSFAAQKISGEEIKNSVTLNKSVIEDIAKWTFKCDINDLAIIEKGLCPMTMDEWVQNEVQKDIIVYRDLPESYENFARIFHSEKWNIAEVEVRHTNSKALIRTYYIIRYK